MIAEISWYYYPVRANPLVFGALSDENRLRILAALLRCPESGCEDVCVCELSDALRIKLSTLSSHLNVLRQAVLVFSRKDGTWVYYRLAENLPKWLLEALAEYTPPHEDTERLALRLRMRSSGKCCLPVGALQASRLGGSS
ncbi:MAG TPA: metalloregulator ArsR/SmtB family transcription factor [Fimbriimonadales bacterium]|nr:metalloregulator ArsR/SmtB family transcription factor [Fimbriimonadales bacterium]